MRFMRAMTGTRIGAVLALLWVGACAAPERVASAGSGAACPPVRSYSDDFRKRAVAELDLLPANSAVEEMLTDYAVLRQQIRACQP
ncbi:MAG: hypothetical protein HY060_04655 [Proteobacteria bacterium]|nr:hypothetical protein [Pseudomonadota bacterium]